MKKVNKKHLFFLIPIGILEIVMLILECLPNGVEIVFSFPDSASGNFVNKVEFYPYFSGMPYNYANFYAIFIGVLTIAIIVLWIANLFADKKGIDIAIFVMTIIKFVFCSVELVYSKTAINWATFAISLVCAVYVVIKAILNKEFAKSKTENVEEIERSQS